MEVVWRGLMVCGMYLGETLCGERGRDGENGCLDGVNKGLSDMNLQTRCGKTVHFMSLLTLQPFLHTAAA